VFVAIMSDKMKEQQRQQQEAERKAAAKKQAALAAPEPTTATTTTSGRRSSRLKANEDTEPDNATAKAQSKKAAAVKKGAKKSAPSKSISSYFKKADVEVKDGNPSVQEALAQAADELEAKPSAIGEQEGLVATEQPSLVTGGKMRQYQLEGLEWMKSLWINGLCGILADEMGLGKTVQTISLIAFFKENNISGPFLIAAPLSTVSNWVDEFQRWTPGINTVLYHGSKTERADLRKQMKLKDQKNTDFPVICTSYEICMNDRAFLSQFSWKYIVVVSIQHILWLPLSHVNDVVG
jgi:ATP-dependent DNA helicase